jgi:hypothetical protein
MEAQHRSPRDADAIARDRAQDQRAGRITGAVDDDTLPRASQEAEQFEKITDDAPGTGLDPYIGQSGVKADKENDDSTKSAAHSTPPMRADDTLGEHEAPIRLRPASRVNSHRLRGL